MVLVGRKLHFLASVAALSIAAACAPVGPEFERPQVEMPVNWSIGPQFVWPFLNYGRIRNNIRVQDARLQQALINYQEVVLQSVREVEDSMQALQGAQAQAEILTKTVVSAQRSNELSVLRYREGFSDYQRVLDSQQSLFTQQQRLVTQRGTAVLNLISLYKSLGGDWETSAKQPLISAKSRQQMQQRTNWGNLLNQSPPANAMPEQSESMNAALQTPNQDDP